MTDNGGWDVVWFQYSRAPRVAQCSCSREASDAWDCQFRRAHRDCHDAGGRRDGGAEDIDEFELDFHFDFVNVLDGGSSSFFYDFVVDDDVCSWRVTRDVDVERSAVA